MTAVGEIINLHRSGTRVSFRQAGGGGCAYLRETARPVDCGKEQDRLSSLAPIAVYDLGALGLPRLTSKYAPPCLVAEGLAGQAQRQIARFNLRSRFWVRGARWDAGTWTCRYQTADERFLPVACTGTYGLRQRITFTLDLKPDEPIEPEPAPAPGP